MLLSEGSLSARTFRKDPKKRPMIKIKNKITGKAYEI
jgi:hypothetical protein